MSNLILITVDCVRADALGCYGGPARTPQLDKLAAQGILYRNAFAHGSFTKTTFPTIFGSSYPSQFGGSRRFTGKRPHIVAYLRKNGYRTLGVNSNPWLSRRFGFDRGYDRYLDLSSSKPTAHSLPVRLANNLLGLVGGGLVYPPYPSAAAVTDTALELLEEAEAPYFLWAHYMDAHWPYAVQGPHLYGPWNREMGAYNARLARKSRKRPEAVTVEEREALFALYRQGIETIDLQLGRLLEAAGAEPAVAVTADHGEAFGEHDRYFHTAGLYRENLRVPLLVRAPDIAAGVVEESIVRHVDLAPTLAAVANVPSHPGFLGHNLLPAAQGKEMLPALAAYGEAHGKTKWWLSWRREGHTVLLLADAATGRVEQRELYDFRRDPLEQQNLSRQQPTRLSKMQKELLTFAATHGDPLKSEPRLKRVPENAESDLRERLKALGYLE